MIDFKPLMMHTAAYWERKEGKLLINKQTIDFKPSMMHAAAALKGRKEGRVGNFACALIRFSVVNCERVLLHTIVPPLIHSFIQPKMVVK